MNNSHNSQPEIGSGDFLDQISRRRRQNLQQKLLAWYRKERRKLPWRRRRHPYPIWISEVMLQQTQTVKVLEYYDRFLRQFPTVEALAAASLDRVLKVWEGMGYYARARNLHRAAQFIITELGGRFPRRYAELLEIPGIGPYTAAAVASIAFNHDHAVVDGNVERVLSRLFRVDMPPKSTAGKKLFPELAQSFLPAGKAREWNQALMELGALICLPQRPLCAACPIRAYCCAFQELEEPAQLPLRLPKRPRPHRHIVAGLVWKDGRLLIDQRRENGLLGGLWEFPGGKIEAGETHETALAREIREELDLEVTVESPVMTVEHGYTHFSVTLHVYRCRYTAGTPKAIACQNWKWVTPEELDQYAFPKANRVIIEALRNSNSGKLPGLPGEPGAN